MLTPHTVLGGASFGGVVALEMAALVPVKKCLLIGSLRSPAGLRPIYRRLRHLSPFACAGPNCALAGLWLTGALCGPLHRSVLRQLAAANGRFLSWAVRALIEWQPSSGIARISIGQVHGQRDWLLPASLSHADLIVPEAGHLLSITHAPAVNDFIRHHSNIVD